MASATSIPRPDATLDETVIHDVLSNERRRALISLLAEGGRPHTVRELSERIAEQESGETPAPRDLRQSVYVSLQQTHLPKLDRIGIVEQEDGSNSVSLAERADDVTVYLEFVPRYGLAWSEYYLAVGFLGILVSIAAAIGVPVLSEVAVAVWGLSFLSVIVLSAAYHTTTLGSTVLHRTRGR